MNLPPLLFVALASKLIALVLWAGGMDARVGAAFFCGPDPFLLLALFVPAAQGLVRVHTRFATTRQEVWLTIDDGPDPDDTPRILDLLDQHGARATFFVIGERAARWPHLIREIVRRGHEIGHHTHTHPAATFWCAGPTRLTAELDRTLATLQENGIRPQRFRAPVGIKHLFLDPVLARRGLSYVGWSVRSGDCRAASPEAVRDHAASKLKPGAILLVHEGPSVPANVRVTGIALLLAAVTARGFTYVVPPADALR